MSYLTKREFLKFMQEYAPKEYAESFDNVGMLIDSGATEFKKVMLALDLTPQTACEARDLGCDLIVTHHPIFFENVKRMSVFDPDTAAACTLIKYGISHFAAHTNLDSARNGTNAILCKLFELENCRSIINKTIKVNKIAVFVPIDSADVVRKAMCSAGAGSLGNYSHCTFSSEGVGTFKPLDGANPAIGSVGKLESVREVRLEMIVEYAYTSSVISAMRSAHPYEEVAFDLYPLEIKDEKSGLLRMGELKKPMNIAELCTYIKKKLNCENVRACADETKMLKSVALCSGSGGSLLDNAIKSGADVFITGDVKHSSALKSVAAGIALIDAGHYETEKPAMNALIQCLQDRFDRVKYNTEFYLTSREISSMKFY